MSSNGKTTVSGTVNVGSIPSIGAKDYMEVKLSYYSLASRYGTKIIIPGTKVCPCNSDESVGIVMNSVPIKDDYWKDESVTVLWQTGKKKGKVSVHNATNLTDFNKFFAAVEEKYNELKALNDQAEDGKKKLETCPER